MAYLTSLHDRLEVHGIHGYEQPTYGGRMSEHILYH